MDAFVFRVCISLTLALVTLGPVVVVADSGTVEPAGPFGFTANSDSFFGTLSVIDLSTGTVVRPEIDLGLEGYPPDAVAIHPDGDEVWIVGAVGDHVTVVDSVTHAVLERISVEASGNYPKDLVFNGDGSLAYVSIRDFGRVAVVDTATYAVTHNFFVTSQPVGSVTFSPARNEVYLLSWGGDSQLYIIDAETGHHKSRSITTYVRDLVLNPAQDTLYITASVGSVTGSVYVFDLDALAVTSSFELPSASDIDMTSDGRRLVVLSRAQGNSSVAIIDIENGGTVTAVDLPTDSGRALDITSDDSVAYVAAPGSTGTGTVFVVDLVNLGIVDTIALGDVHPISIAVTPDAVNPLVFADGFESGDTSAWCG